MYRVVCEYRIYAGPEKTVMTYRQKETADTICERLNAVTEAKAKADDDHTYVCENPDCREVYTSRYRKDSPCAPRACPACQSKMAQRRYRERQMQR